MIEIVFGTIISIAFIVYLVILIWSLIKDSKPKDTNPWKLIRTDVLPSGFEQMSNERYNYDVSIKQAPMQFYQKKIVYVWKNTLTSEIKTEQVKLHD